MTELQSGYAHPLHQHCCSINDLNDHRATEDELHIGWQSEPFLNVPIQATNPVGGAQVDGEAEETQIVETDIVTCSARVLLTRPSHSLPGDILFTITSSCIILRSLPSCVIAHCQTRSSLGEMLLHQHCLWDNGILWLVFQANGGLHRHCLSVPCV